MRKQDELEWIDLGPEFDCIWLNKVYEKNGKNYFTWEEAKNIVESIPGADFPTKDELGARIEYYDGKLYIEGSKNRIEPFDGFCIWNNKGGVYSMRYGIPESRLALKDEVYPILLVKRRVNETHWGGMVRRSSGEVKRKEDEIDHLGRDEFVIWLMNTYKINKDLGSNPSIVKGETSSIEYIQIPLFMVGYKLYRLAVVYENDEMKEIDILAERDWCGEFIEKLCEKFNVSVSSRNGGLKITKDGRVSNSICVEIIDTVMENTSKRIYDKVK